MKEFTIVVAKVGGYVTHSNMSIEVALSKFVAENKFPEYVMPKTLSELNGRAGARRKETNDWRSKSKRGGFNGY